MTVTTLGSNIIPVTDIGKISTATVAITGITIFPIFTVYITNLIQDWKAKEKEREEQTKTIVPPKEAVDHPNLTTSITTDTNKS